MRNQIASIGINQSEETYLLAPKSLYKGEPLLEEPGYKRAGLHYCNRYRPSQHKAGFLQDRDVVPPGWPILPDLWRRVERVEFLGNSKRPLKAVSQGRWLFWKVFSAPERICYGTLIITWSNERSRPDILDFFSFFRKPSPTVGQEESGA